MLKLFSIIFHVDKGSFKNVLIFTCLHRNNTEETSDKHLVVKSLYDLSTLQMES